MQNEQSNNQNDEMMKRRILECAAKIVQQEGVKSLSILKIATECKISKSTFYMYFHSKTDLLQSLHEDFHPESLDIQSTREKIIANAIEQFSRDNFNEIDIETIAVSAGISRSSIYRYFANKEELLESAIQNEMKNRQKYVAAIKIEADNPLRFIEQYIEYFDRYANHKYTNLLYAACIYYSKTNPKIKASFDDLREYTVRIFRESFEEGKRLGIFKTNFDSASYAQMFFSVMAGMHIHSPAKFGTVAKQFFGLLYREIKI